jgi:DNA-binding MarR family transcriptional regulator
LLAYDDYLNKFEFLFMLSRNDVYVRFLNLVAAFDLPASVDEALDPDGMKLLEEIVRRQVSGSTMTVTEIMKLGDLASPATLYRRIDKLKAAGILRGVMDPDDRRIKRLTVTDLGERVLLMYSKAMVKAVNG